MSWPADLFELIVTAAGVPTEQHHTLAQEVVVGVCGALLLAGLAWAIGVLCEANGARRVLRGCASCAHEVRRAESTSCMRTAKEV